MIMMIYCYYCYYYYYYYYSPGQVNGQMRPGTGEARRQNKSGPLEKSLEINLGRCRQISNLGKSGESGRSSLPRGEARRRGAPRRGQRRARRVRRRPGRPRHGRGGANLISCIVIDSIIIMIFYTMMHYTMSQASTDDTPKSPNTGADVLAAVGSALLVWYASPATRDPLSSLRTRACSSQVNANVTNIIMIIITMSIMPTMIII